MLLFYQLVRNSKLYLTGAILVSLISAVVGVLLISFINIGVVSGSVPLGLGLTLFLVLLLILFVSTIASDRLMSVLGHTVIYKLRVLFANRVVATPFAHLEKLGPGKIYATLTTDIASISSAFIILPLIIFNLCILLAGFVYLGILSWQYLLITLGLIFLAVLVGQYLRLKMERRFVQIRELQDGLHQSFQGLIYGNKELKLNTRRARHFLDANMQRTAEKLSDTSIKADLYWAISTGWTNIIFFSILGFILFSASYILPAGNSVKVGYLLTLIFLKAPLEMLLGAIPTVVTGSVSLHKIERLNLSDAPIEPPGDPRPELAQWQQLELRGVSYNYDSDDKDFSFHFGPVDFSLQQGEIVFVVGGNGSGKSTLAKLITGLYRSPTGSIRFGGEPISSDADFHWYRNHFSTVFTDFYLFEQIVFDQQGEFDKELLIQSYLEKLCLQKKVQVNEGKLSTIDLSQGQKKRLALLSAYIENRQIFLFDEWAADQDPSFKEVFYKELLPELKRAGKTVLAITHDDRYFSQADRIVKLEDGLITEVNVLPHNKAQYKAI